jgi:hypothetical protein
LKADGDGFARRASKPELFEKTIRDDRYLRHILDGP